MRALIITAALAAALAAHAAEPIVIESDNGGKWRGMPETARTYTNVHGVAQSDMLWHSVDKDGTGSRDRIGVTGCDKGMGLIAFVDPSGKVIGKPMEWASSGSAVLDGIAMHTCATTKR